ncbi:MAG TPA: nucleotidyltransferase family protein [Novosphingobium sp.]|nr:nucleotidyltransferase family protein [Novosphingobium sp.]
MSEAPANGLVSIVLAAGAGRRFGGDKLSAPFLGEPLIRHAIRAARAAPVDRVIVVAGPGLDPGMWEGSPPVERVAIVSDTLSTSLKAGVLAARGASGAFVFLGDMPLVPHGIAARLADALGEGYAALPRHEGSPGHPVLLSAAAFDDVAMLQGDRGAGPLLAGRDDVRFLDREDASVLLDVDRPEELAALEREACRR